MNIRFHLVVLSTVAVSVGLAGCEAGPSTPVTQAPQEQPAPSAAVAESTAPREFTAIPELTSVHFDLDRAQIRSAEARRLEEHARWLKSHGDMVVLIGGHADERGSDDYNLRLGERRADAIRQFMIARGVEADRITTASYGEERPVCSAQGESCWGKNRRAEFQVRGR